MLDEWVEKVCDELSIDDEVDIDELLDLARDVAHGVERRAAPIATFLVGLAAGRGEGVESVEEAVRRVRSLT
jgi:Domain of unknown function (DUF6457)